jgi:hypothetical protein
MRELSNSAYYKHWLLRAGRRRLVSIPSSQNVADHSEEPWSNYQKLHDNGLGTVLQFHRLLSKRDKTSPRGVPRTGPSLRYLLGLIELPSEAHEHGYWCISFVNLQAHRSKGWFLQAPRERLAGVPTLRLISSTTLGSKASSPRDIYHLDRGSMQGLCMCGELRADTKKGDCMGQPVNQNRTGRGFDLLMPHGAAVSQNVWVCFSEGARFPLSWDVATTLRQPQVYSSTSLSTSHASHAHCRRKKWASRGMTHSINIGYHLNSVPASPDIPNKCSTHDSR